MHNELLWLMTERLAELNCRKFKITIRHSVWHSRDLYISPYMGTVTSFVRPDTIFLFKKTNNLHKLQALLFSTVLHLIFYDKQSYKSLILTIRLVIFNGTLTHFLILSPCLPHFFSLPFFFLNLSLDSFSQYLSCSVTELSVLSSIINITNDLFFNARSTFIVLKQIAPMFLKHLKFLICSGLFVTFLK